MDGHIFLVLISDMKNEHNESAVEYIFKNNKNCFNCIVGMALPLQPKHLAIFLSFSTFASLVICLR